MTVFLITEKKVISYMQVHIQLLLQWRQDAAVTYTIITTIILPELYMTRCTLLLNTNLFVMQRPLKTP